MPSWQDATVTGLTIDHVSLHYDGQVRTGMRSLPYSDPNNSEIAMDLAPDRYRYVLERRVVREPGQRFSHPPGWCNGAAGAHRREGGRQLLHGFAREVLFDPLGARPTEWLTGRDGEPIAASDRALRRASPRSA